MSLNFPVAVSSGTQYLAPNGVTYVFDGYKWVGYPVIQQFSSTNGIFNNGYTIQLDSHGNLEFPTYTFPISTGTAGQVLTWPDTGNLLAWVTPQGGSTGTAGGSYLQNVEYRLSLNNDGSITVPNTINAASTGLNFNFVGSYADSAIPAVLYTGTTSGTTIYITTSNAFPGIVYNPITGLFDAVINGTSGDVVNAPISNLVLYNYNPYAPPGYLYEYSFTITGGQQFQPGHYYILSQPNDVYNIKLSATDDEGGLAPAGVSYGTSNYQYFQSNKGGKLSFQSSTVGNNPNASYSSIIYDGVGGISLNGSSDVTDEDNNGYTQLLWAGEPITTLGQVNHGFTNTPYAYISLQPEITPNGLIGFTISPNGNSSLGYTWSMNYDGSMLYPDGTNQYTAWPGSLSRLNLGEGAISVNDNGDIIPSNDLISNVGGPFNRINQIYFGNATVYSTPSSVLTINGSTLTNFNTSLSGILNDVVYSPKLNQYVAVGSVSPYGSQLFPLAMYSSDGISWNTASSSLFSTTIGGLNTVVVIPVDGSFIAAGVDQSNGSTSTFVITSSDGINWSGPQRLTEYPIAFNSPTPMVALGINVYMGYNNYNNYESTLLIDFYGEVWTQLFDGAQFYTYNPTQGLPNQTVGNMFVNGAGQILYFSGDLNNPAYSVSNSYGYNIDYNNTTSNVFLHTACWIPDQYQWLAAGSPKGQYGTLYFYTSQDGVNWYQLTSNIDGFNGYASSIAYNGNTYVVVGINYNSSYQGFIFSSSDVVTWTESGYAVEYDTFGINKVIWGNSQFILVANDFTNSYTRIAVSNNGLTWNEVGVETGTTQSTVYNPWSFNNDGSFTMATGANTGIITVPDGWGENIYFGTNAPSFDGIRITGIGHNAARYGPGSDVVAVGSNAGNTNQGATAIAIGSNAGQQNQGANAIAIGYAAASSHQPVNQIEINATGESLAGSNTNALYVAPIRSDLHNTKVIMYYNTATKEVTYAPSPTPATSTSTSVPPTNPTLGTTWYDTTTGLVSMWTTDGTSFFWLDVDGPTVSNTTASIITSYTTNYYSTTTINTGTYYTIQTVMGSRVQVTATTALLTAGSSSTVSVTGFKGYSLYSMQVNAPAWVSVYTSAAARTADATRSITVDPTPGSGVIAEVVTTQSGITYFTPAIMGFSTESPPTTAIPMKVYNNGSISTTITVTLTLLQLEN